jgi:sugar phosphate isomerase/epimerase
MSQFCVFSDILINLPHGDKEECLAYAVSRGYGLEIRDIDWSSATDHLAIRARSIERYRGITASIPGLTAVHGPDSGNLSPGHTEPQVVAETRECVTALLDLAEELGIPRVIWHTWLDVQPFEEWGLAGWVERNAAFWREALTGRSVEVCLENSWGDSPELLAGEVDEISLPNVGACLDVGHAHLQGGNRTDEWVEALGPRIRHMHLHDNDGASDQHHAVGDGTVDWHRVIAALRQNGLTPAATLEVAGMSRVAASVAHLRRLEVGRWE